jgi:hypothetical protein
MCGWLQETKLKNKKQMSPHEAGDPGWECRLALRREFHPQFLTRAGLT